ncbi:MAG TPA: choice-of-anchor tandem repeat GloVer-containing protein, partial [Roseiarcus sp.]
MRLWRRAAKALPVATLPIVGAVAEASAYTLHTLHDFCSQASCADGSAPLGALVADSAGNLYGTAVKGGADGHGTVFELLKKSETDHRYRVLYSFCQKTNCADGDQPASTLILDTAGNLYGTTVVGGAGHGLVFELSTGARPRLQVLQAFCRQTGCADGDIPGAPLTYAGADTGALYDGVSPLYGTTNAGGAHHNGAVFQLTSVPGQRRRSETVL